MGRAHTVDGYRADRGTTVSGPGAGSRVFIEGKLAAVEGDLSSHDLLGAIQSLSPGTVKVMGMKLAVNLMDSAAPDALGAILHPEGLPTPATGAQRTNVYDLGGTMGGGLGNFGLSGMPDVGNLMQFGSQIIGQVMRTVNSGAGNMLLMNNMSPNNTNPGVGDTITSANTGQTFTFSSYYTS